MQYQSSHSTSVTTGRRTTTKGSRSLHMIAVLCLLFMDHDSFLSNFSLVQRELGNQQFPPPSYPTSSPIRSTDPKGVATDDDNNNFTTFPSIPSTPPETLGYFHIPDNSTVWVVDVEYNLCLSSYGFSACGEMNLWVWRRSEKGVQLQALQQHHAHDGEDAQQHGLVDENRHDSQNLCLGRKRFSNKLKLKSCSSSVLDGGTTYWRYDAETGMMQSFGIRSKSNMLLKNNLFGDIKCIANDHSHQSMHDYAITRKCKSFYTPLKIIPVPFAAIDNKKKSAHPSSLLPEKNPLVDEGEWKCPHTGLVIPRNLDRYFEEDDSSTHQRRFGRQVLMGAGVFTKVSYSLY